MMPQRLGEDEIAALHARLKTRRTDRAQQACLRAGVSADVEKIALLVEYQRRTAQSGDMLSDQKLESLAVLDAAVLATHVSNIPAPLDCFDAAVRQRIAAAGQNRMEDSAAETFFGGGTRVYFALPKTDFLPDVERSVRQYLTGGEYSEWSQDEQRFIRHKPLPQKYIVTDYYNGYATDQARKQTYRIGKLLKSVPTLQKKFMEDESRTVNGHGFLIVFSRDPQDLARMSANRRWGSCMSPDGTYATDLPNDIRKGSIIAYLIHNSDPDIDDPLGRILLKPYEQADSLRRFVNYHEGRATALYNENFLDYGDWLENHVAKPLHHAIAASLSTVFCMAKNPPKVFVPGKFKGVFSPLFDSTVKTIAEKYLNAGKAGTFRLGAGVYPDSQPKRIERKQPLP